MTHYIGGQVRRRQDGYFRHACHVRPSVTAAGKSSKRRQLTDTGLNLAPYCMYRLTRGRPSIGLNVCLQLQSLLSMTHYSSTATIDLPLTRRLGQSDDFQLARYAALDVLSAF